MLVVLLGAGGLLGAQASRPVAESDTGRPPRLTFRFEAGAASSTIVPIARPGQSLATVLHNEVPCLTLARLPGGNGFWHFALPRKVRNIEFGDATLTVEFYAQSPSLNWLLHPSRFHEFHRLDTPELGGRQSGDAAIPATWVRRERGLFGLVRLTFSLRKACFQQAFEGGSHLQLVPDTDTPVFMRRLSLEVTPLTEADRPATAPTFPRLIDRIYRRFLDRSPTPFEWQRLATAFRQRELTLKNLLRNLVKSWEYQDRNVRNLDNLRAIRRLFWRACRRPAGLADLESIAIFFQDTCFDHAGQVFWEKFYGETIESILAELPR